MVNIGRGLLRWSVANSPEGLRTRFRPSCRINMLFLAVVPWIDVIILGTVAYFTFTKHAAVPGVVVDLPAVQIQSGTHIGTDLVVVVNTLPKTSAPAMTVDNALSMRGEFGFDGQADGRAAQTTRDPEAIRALVFFNDERFVLTRAGDRASLKKAIADRLRGKVVASGDALMYVDKRVAHGDTIAVLSILREAGVRHVNMTAREL